MPINYSIIIPHRDIPELLVRCIKSIPDRDDIQIIVVDDNSDDADSYKKIYPELNRPDIELYLTNEGRGAGYARNIGLEKVKGKWILFADADDFFLPEWTTITDQYLDSEADVIQFKIEDILNQDDCKWHNLKIERCLEGKISKRDSLFLNITCWAKMFNADFILNSSIFFEETICANDVGFGFQVAVKARNIIIDPLAIYDLTYREGSITTIKNKEYSWVRYEVQKRANTFAAKNGFRRFELPYVIEVLKSWRKSGLFDYLWFICHEQREIRRASKIMIDSKPFNYRHPYLYTLLVLFKMI